MATASELQAVADQALKDFDKAQAAWNESQNRYFGADPRTRVKPSVEWGNLYDTMNQAARAWAEACNALAIVQDS